MIKKSILIYFGLVFLFILFICAIPPIKNIKTYYLSGKLKSSGWYINDTIHVGAFYQYFEDGKVGDITYYDNSGHLNGPNKRYYENGNLCELSTFVNDVYQGYDYRYYENGTLQSKVFVLDGEQRGDSYFYAKDGSEHYNFIDFKNNNRNYIKSDGKGGFIAKNKYPLYVDSIVSTYDSTDLDCEYNYDVTALISNKPKCRTTYSLVYLSQNGVIMKTDSVTDVPYYHSKDRFMDSLNYINVFSTQYDSITGKTIHQERVNEIYDEL